MRWRGMRVPNLLNPIEMVQSEGAVKYLRGEEAPKSPAGAAGTFREKSKGDGTSACLVLFLHTIVLLSFVGVIRSGHIFCEERKSSPIQMVLGIIRVHSQNVFLG